MDEMKQDTISKSVQQFRRIFRKFGNELSSKIVHDDTKIKDFERATEAAKRIFLQILICELLQHLGILKISEKNPKHANLQMYLDFLDKNPCWKLKNFNSVKLQKSHNLNSINVKQTITELRNCLNSANLENIEDTVYFLVYSFESLIEFKFTRCKTSKNIKLEISDNRKKSGSYFTPKMLVKYTVKSALDAFLRKSKQLNVAELKICDPALGGGLFLIESADYLYEKTDQTSVKSEFFKQMFEKNLYGVDKNPLAIEISMIAFKLRCFPLCLSEKKLRKLLKVGDSLLCISKKRVNSLIPKLKRGKLKLEISDNPKTHAITHKQLKCWCNLWFSKHSDDELFRKLRDFTRSPSKFEAQKIVSQTKAFCWEFEFPEIFADGEPGFDLIISNPPYRSYYSRYSGKNADKSVLFERFASANLSEISGMKAVTGRINYFLLFIVRATELLKKTNGTCSFVLPDTILMNEGYTNMRQALLNSGLLKEAAFFNNQQFRGATVGTSVLTWQKGSQQNLVTLKSVSTDIKNSKFNEKQKKYSQNQIQSRPYQSLLFTEQIEVLPKENFVRLSEIAHVKDGINPGKREIRDKIICNLPNTKTKKLIEGSNINKFSISWQNKYVIYDNDLITKQHKHDGTSLRKAWIFDSPKIVYRQTSPEIIAAVDLNKHYALNSVQCIILHELNNQLLFALCAYLNSGFLRKIYQNQTGETRKTYPQVHVSAVKNLPIPKKLLIDLDTQFKISEIARKLTNNSTLNSKNVILNSETFERFSRKIDNIVNAVVLE